MITAANHPILFEALQNLLSLGPTVTILLLALAGSVAFNVYLFRKLFGKAA